MADITMCEGSGCCYKRACHRYTATVGGRQSFFTSVPLEENGECHHFLDNGKLLSIQRPVKRER